MSEQNISFLIFMGGGVLLVAVLVGGALLDDYLTAKRKSKE